MQGREGVGKAAEALAAGGGRLAGGGWPCRRGARAGGELEGAWGSVGLSLRRPRPIHAGAAAATKPPSRCAPPRRARWQPSGAETANPVKPIVIVKIRKGQVGGCFWGPSGLEVARAAFGGAGWLAGRSNTNTDTRTRPSTPPS